MLDHAGRQDSARTVAVKGRRRLRPKPSEPGEGVAASLGQKDDGTRNPQGSPRNRHRLKKTSVAHALSAEGRFKMKTVCETLGVARSNIAAHATRSPSKARGRPSRLHAPPFQLECRFSSTKTNRSDPDTPKPSFTHRTSTLTLRSLLSLLITVFTGAHAFSSIDAEAGRTKPPPRINANANGRAFCPTHALYTRSSNQQAAFAIYGKQ